MTLSRQMSKDWSFSFSPRTSQRGQSQDCSLGITDNGEMSLSLMMMIEIESESAITAGVISGFVQIDEDFGVAQSTTATIARNYASLARDRRNLSDEINGVHLYGEFAGIHESRILVIFGIPSGGRVRVHGQSLVLREVLHAFIVGNDAVFLAHFLVQCLSHGLFLGGFFL